MLQSMTEKLTGKEYDVCPKEAGPACFGDSGNRLRFLTRSLGAVLVFLTTLVSLPCVSQSPTRKPGPFGGFASAPTYSVPAIDAKVDSITSIAAADLNGDGKADAVVGLTDGIAILLNDGAGHLTNSSSIPLVASPGTLTGSYQHVLVAIGDVNGDGKPDIAASVNGNVWVLLNNGDGTFTKPAAPYSSGLVFSIAIGDVTGDGKPDIALLLGASVIVMKGNGDGTFLPFVALNNSTGNFYLPVQQYFSGGVVGDVNEDGKPDLVASGYMWCGGSACANQDQIASGASVTTTLTVNTTAATSTALVDNPLLHESEGVLAALLLLGVPRKKWKHWGVLTVLAFIAIGMISACGGSGSTASGGSGGSNPGTTMGSYVVTVSATSGTARASAQIPLSVQ